MALDYAKWDKLCVSDDDETSDGGSATAIRRAGPIATDSIGQYKLYTVPWDSHCEMVRWVLDLHGANYEEFDMPWGLHLWGTLGTSDPMPKPQQTAVPVLVNQKNETFRTPTAIIMYMYSQAFSGRVRLYSKTEALDLQQELDGAFADAAKLVFLRTMLSSPTLAAKYLRDNVHLNTWRSVNEFLWPLLRITMWRYFGLGSRKRIHDSWQTINDTFRKIETLLASTHASTAGHKSLSALAASPNAFLTGTTLSAADISFASHAALVLFPNPDDGFGEKMGLLLPGTNALPAEVAKRVKELRDSPAGQFAARMYRKERGMRLARHPSKHAHVNNPEWASQNYLRVTAINYSAIFMLALGIPGAFLPYEIALVSWACYAALFYIFVVHPNRNSIVLKRLSQIWFVLTAKSTSAAAGERKHNSQTHDSAVGEAAALPKHEPQAPLLCRNGTNTQPSN
ncbi:hypothetical protein HK105_201801 [Polyrhizophydium stewartii]|uniref:Glutathione S-transferase n=1 Tax=Polyrhizophydium stewartii TaxID=2732419 RepID=A0ABR4NFW5_9FUNG|nr:hypothetical protein HK105_004091 [Polyrhizophydium stewartii]